MVGLVVLPHADLAAAQNVPALRVRGVDLRGLRQELDRCRHVLERTVLETEPGDVLEQLRVVGVILHSVLVRFHSLIVQLLELVDVSDVQPDVRGRAGRRRVVHDERKALEGLRVLLRLLVDRPEAVEDLLLLVRVWVHLEHARKRLLRVIEAPAPLVEHPDPVPHLGVLRVREVEERMLVRGVRVLEVVCQEIRERELRPQVSVIGFHLDRALQAVGRFPEVVSPSVDLRRGCEGGGLVWVVAESALVGRRGPFQVVHYFRYSTNAGPHRLVGVA
mmetsp:Transcript_3419/g.7733  ORF Transcript_3419/g.7733 Transcript_3419/m.7733 type:complete len:276 (+) Transcript_3419:651-1478(+)